MSENLIAWLEKIRFQHRFEIDLSLARVKKVARQLNVLPFSCPVVTVGGTNGKGSTVAGLEKIWLTAGYKVGAFTSPWLYRFNEIVRIQGEPVSDEWFIRAFEKIEAARNKITLTQFEFNTLAALFIFQHFPLDVIILEVGLGGRLDAVNIVDADMAIITSIDLDHTDRLGSTREKIGFEKAGIFRSNQLIICGDLSPPVSLVKQANALSSSVFYQSKSFGWEEKTNHWNFWSTVENLNHLPKPNLLLQNMACVLQAVSLFQKKLPLDSAVIKRALSTVYLPGRLESRTLNGVQTIIDVSHNPAAAKRLCHYLKTHPVNGKTRAVFSMLNDKDIQTTICYMTEVIDEWYVAPLEAPRAASLESLKNIFAQIKQSYFVKFTSTIQKAYSFTQEISQAHDRIVVFGSFYTVSALILGEE